MDQSDDESRIANICMTVIGIGYLFPISAIWAAFDYWRELFPTQNIEFTVTLVYQAISLATVGVLSLASSFRLGPRIYGGFCGQFVSLFAILSFRWISVLLPSDALYGLVLVLVALCALATGYLDSALLALCSQYSSRMQGFLQLGIGFGTLVSVLYRDGTKLMLEGDMADSVTAYFSIALVTVLVCISCYRKLMKLPVSRIAALADQCEPLLTPPGSPGREVSLHHGATLLSTPTSSPLVFVRQDSKDSDVVAENGKQQKEPETSLADVTFGGVLKIVWANQLAIFLNLLLTTLCYPGMLTSIPCRNLLLLREGAWFETLLLTVFTFSDIVGRFLTHVRCGLTWQNIWLTVVVRSALFPFILLCVMSSSVPDELSILCVSLFGALNGYCVSVSLIVINELPMLDTEQRKTCGRISACSVNGGLAVGSLLAAVIASSLGLGATATD